MHTEPQSMVKRNTLAIAGLITGILSIVLAPLFYVSGYLFLLFCVGPVIGILAVTAGVLGLRAARNLSGQGHKTAIAGIAIGGISLLVFIGIFIYLGQRYSTITEKIREALTPQSFEGGGIQLTYPGDWQSININELDIDKQPGIEYLLVIRHTPDDGTRFTLMQIGLQRKASVEEVDLELWKQYESTIPDISLESRETIEIGGQSAVRRICAAPSEYLPGEQEHIMLVFFVKELTLYHIFSRAPSTEVFKQHRAEIDEIIASINFVP